MAYTLKYMIIYRVPIGVLAIYYEFNSDAADCNRDNIMFAELFVLFHIIIKI